MLLQKISGRPEAEMARFIEDEVRVFISTSPANHLPFTKDDIIFDEPLVQFANGDDPIFTDYKTIIAPTHLTPRQALARAYSKTPEDMPARLSVISWILPIVDKTRKSNRNEALIPTRRWAYTRWYGEKFNDALRRHLVEILAETGYLATAPILQPYFSIDTNKQGDYSNWSERHIAYAAGLGTFSLGGSLITERGVAHRCGSVVTDLALPASPRTAENPYSNCLFYTDDSCKACIVRCPATAITEKGQDKVKCERYMHNDIVYLRKEYEVGIVGCGLCQTKVPCESCNPVKNSHGKRNNG
jgi:epoxyqueuosine reductase QueG